MQFAAGLDSNNLRTSLFISVANPLNRPCGVLCDQWFWVGCNAFEGWKIRWITDITKRDTHIA